jgi:hypothetical protein
MKKVLATVGLLLGVFLMARAVAWPFQIDAGDPASYANDWGGPNLLGVAAVHCGPGIIVAAILIGLIVRSRWRAGIRHRAGALPKS